MDHNQQQWDEHWLYMQQQGRQGRRGETTQTSSNGSYSPYSTTSDLSSSSHGSYTWAPGTAPFDGAEGTVHAGASHNSMTMQSQNVPAVQHYVPHAQHCPHHVGTHPTGSTCQYCTILHQFRESSWRRAHEIEARDPGNGQSILLVLLEVISDPTGVRIYGCRICERTFSRQDRALTHLRHEHLDHRPYACGGRCGQFECEQRFHSQENLAPHLNPKMVDCLYCDHKCLRQNLKRHIQRYHPDKPEAQTKPM